jgi:hypothetical protein
MSPGEKMRSFCQTRPLTGSRLKTTFAEIFTHQGIAARQEEFRALGVWFIEPFVMAAIFHAKPETLIQSRGRIASLGCPIDVPAICGGSESD